MRSTAGRLQAEALGVKLCRWSEELVYELSLLRHDGRVIHVFIDAKNGSGRLIRRRRIKWQGENGRA